MCLCVEKLQTDKIKETDCYCNRKGQELLWFLSPCKLKDKLCSSVVHSSYYHEHTNKYDPFAQHLFAWPAERTSEGSCRMPYGALCWRKFCMLSVAHKLLLHVYIWPLLLLSNKEYMSGKYMLYIYWLTYFFTYLVTSLLGLQLYGSFGVVRKNTTMQTCLDTVKTEASERHAQTWHASVSLFFFMLLTHCIQSQG